jgi:hypothetical protein
MIWRGRQLPPRTEREVELEPKNSLLYYESQIPTGLSENISVDAAEIRYTDLVLLPPLERNYDFPSTVRPPQQS